MARSKFLKKQNQPRKTELWLSCHREARPNYGRVAHMLNLKPVLQQLKRPAFEYMNITVTYELRKNFEFETFLSKEYFFLEHVKSLWGGQNASVQGGMMVAALGLVAERLREMTFVQDYLVVRWGDSLSKGIGSH